MSIVEQNKQERQRLRRDIKRLKHFNYFMLAIALSLVIISSAYLLWSNFGG